MNKLSISLFLLSIFFYAAFVLLFLDINVNKIVDIMASINSLKTLTAFFFVIIFTTVTIYIFIYDLYCIFAAHVLKTKGPEQIKFHFGVEGENTSIVSNEVKFIIFYPLLSLISVLMNLYTMKP